VGEVIKTKIQLEEYDQLEATLTLTMKVHEWRKFRNQISDTAYPCTEIWKAVYELLEKADNTFKAELRKEESK
jgi:hypothetical protein